MPNRLTAAMEEAYASAPVGVGIVETLELSHPSLQDPIRVAAGVEEAIQARLTAGGTLATFQPCAFSFIPPAVSEGGIEPAEISIDAVGRLLIDALDTLVLGGVAISVTYRAYTSNNLNTPGEVWTGFRIRKISTDGRTTRAEVEFDDISTTAFPRAIYDQTTFPGLYAGQQAG